MEAAYESQQQPLMSGLGSGGGIGGGAPLPSSSFEQFASTMLAPARWGSLPLALQQHPSALMAALAVALLLALQTTAPVAAAWAMLAAALSSALLQILTHTRSGGRHLTAGPRGSSGGPRARAGGGSGSSGGAKIGSPSALASLSLDAAVAIAAASWLIVFRWADPPGRDFWLRWQPTLVLGLLATELLLAALVGLPCASPLLHDKAPPLLLQMDLAQRPVAGSPAEAPWLRRLARDVTLTWALVAALAAACCCVPAALGRHAFANGGGPGGGSGGGGEGGWAKGGWAQQAGAGAGDDQGPAPGDADPLDVALSVCAPFALIVLTAALSDAVLERARRAHLPRMMAEASRAAAAAGAGSGSGGGGGDLFAAPPGGAMGV